MSFKIKTLEANWAEPGNLGTVLTDIFRKISYVLMVRVKIACFYQELDLEFSLYRPKVCLGVLSLLKKSLT